MKGIGPHDAWVKHQDSSQQRQWRVTLVYGSRPPPPVLSLDKGRGGGMGRCNVSYN